MTLKQLAAGTLKLRKAINTDGLKASMIRIFPNTEDSTVFITANIKGREKYKVSLLFDKIKVIEGSLKKKCDSKLIKVLSHDKKYYCISQLSYSKHNVKVRCTCEDYRFVWSFYNKKYDALYGGPFEKYVRVTPPPSKGGRPRVNELKVPGMCKHIFGLVELLMNTKLGKHKLIIP